MIRIFVDKFTPKSHQFLGTIFGATTCPVPALGDLATTLIPHLTVELGEPSGFLIFLEKTTSRTLKKVALIVFSRMRSEGSRFIWGSGGEAVFAESCVYVRNRPQPFATVRNRLRVRRKALHSGECAWSDPESVSS